MKIKLLLFFSVVIMFITCNSTDNAPAVSIVDKNASVQAALRRAPFSKGVNFSGWFESFSAGGIPFTKYTEQDFADVKSLGADVIRLPVKMHSMTSGAPDYTLDPLLFRFLDIAVGWAEKYGLYIIIDNHSFDPVRGLEDSIDRILLPVWTQVARRYRNRSDYVIYEILNEPHGISDARWGEVQGMAVDTIRRIDQKHAIIVGGTDYNSIGKLSALPRYSDPNLIYTFHFYDPHIFTHQGAGWGEPSLASLSGVPFPYDSRRIPRVPADLRGTWIEGALSGYERIGSAQALNAALDRVVSFSRERGVPVFCGEFGVYMIQSPPRDRVTWYEFTADALDRRNISRTSWDYYGGFGVFNSEMGSFAHDLNTDVVRAMGFTPPPQTQITEQPFDAGFVIFDDFPNRKYVTSNYWGGNSGFSLYDNNSAAGDFAILWGNVPQYNAFSFLFDRSGGDFSFLAQEGFFLEFRVRAERPVRFDVRFLNGESSTSIPWRMRYTIDENIFPPDGRWHTIRVPLAGMSEHGAWVSASRQWLSPRGGFSWKRVERLEFVAEHSDLTGIRIWFDEIKISR